ncbi:hypothetical protein F2Q68_00041500 [Brassica cretica]|uniref:Uncharacterized protein n=1 Tax=Brassica cretica TaxID=69181 RepID=A0A8S9MQW8_BRACR|nr:hypothetical protein F2Q68_00041500 [Brassica cretica]
MRNSFTELKPEFMDQRRFMRLRVRKEDKSPRLYLRSDFVTSPRLYLRTGSINISNILTGKCLAKITSSSGPPKEDESSSSSSSLGNNSKQRRNAVAEALEDITALFYDEERNEIYTGNRHGFVHMKEQKRFNKEFQLMKKEESEARDGTARAKFCGHCCSIGVPSNL